MSDPVEAARSEASRERLAGRGYEGEADLRRALREDGHLGVRAEAAHLLGFDGAADAAGDLEHAVRDDDSARVRVEAALALGRLGRPRRGAGGAAAGSWAARSSPTPRCAPRGRSRCSATRRAGRAW